MQPFALAENPERQQPDQTSSDKSDLVGFDVMERSFTQSPYKFYLQRTEKFCGQIQSSKVQIPNF